MLFNSYVFIFAFFPIVFFGFYTIGEPSHALASLWLAAASLFFYGWWDVRYVSLLLVSIVFNYAVGYLIARSLARTQANQPRMLLVVAIAVANLILLGYFKYAHFFVDNLNPTGTTLSLGQVTLPLGISFFTFTQIAFLVDTYQRKVKEFDFCSLHAVRHLFPSPDRRPGVASQGNDATICKAQRLPPQLGQRRRRFSIFVLGLAKKVLIADSLAEFATPIFSAVTAGEQVMLFESWIGALAYTLQLYFDFSGYSDMAIGLSLMFGICASRSTSTRPIRRPALSIFGGAGTSRYPAFYATISTSRSVATATVKPALCEPDGHHVARRSLAWRRLDLFLLGRVARFLSFREPCLART